MSKTISVLLTGFTINLAKTRRPASICVREKVGNCQTVGYIDEVYLGRRIIRTFITRSTLSGDLPRIYL